MEGNPRPRPRIIDKQRPEAAPRHKKSERHQKQSDKDSNLDVPSKLRHGARHAFHVLARRNAAMGGH